MASIRRWWEKVGQARYGQSSRLLIMADGGGSNGSRVRLWKWKLQSLADQRGMDATRDGAPPIDLVDSDQLIDKLKELHLGVEVEMKEDVIVLSELFKHL